MHLITIREAARMLGVSLDTIRRWDRAGSIRVERDAANRRMLDYDEVRRIARMRSEPTKARPGSSARNRLRCTVTDVSFDGLLARVELETVEPARLVAIITREAAQDLDLQVGSPAAAIVKATSMMVAEDT